MANLTMKQALDIQLSHIDEWAKVLNTETYLRLLRDISERNAKGYESPYDVVRGSDISNMIHNYMIN